MLQVRYKFNEVSYFEYSKNFIKDEADSQMVYKYNNVISTQCLKTHEGDALRIFVCLFILFVFKLLYVLICECIMKFVMPYVLPCTCNNLLRVS